MSSSLYSCKMMVITLVVVMMTMMTNDGGDHDDVVMIHNDNIYPNPKLKLKGPLPGSISSSKS